MQKVLLAINFLAPNLNHHTTQNFVGFDRFCRSLPHQLFTNFLLLKVAINTRLLRANRLEGIGRFTHEICQRLVQNHPEVQFYFLFDAPWDQQFIYAKNVRPLLVLPPARRAWLWDLWFDAALPLVFSALQPDVFFSPDGHLPRNPRVPTVPVMHDLNFLHHPNWVPDWAQRYYAQRFPVFARKAAHILTVSEFSKHDIAQHYQIQPEKISVVYNAASEIFRPQSETTNHQTRQNTTQGAPYFFVIGAINPRKNLVRTIQAYDLWCAQTDAPHHLVVAGGAMFEAGVVAEAREAAHHKRRIHFLGHVPDVTLVQLLAASAGLVYASLFEGFGIPVLEAFQCGVPVLTSNNSALPEVGGAAAFYCDAEDVQSIAMGLQALADAAPSKAQEGFAQASKFSWDASADGVWNVLKNAANVGT